MIISYKVINMKKMFILSLFFIGIIFLSGCKGKFDSLPTFKSTDIEIVSTNWQSGTDCEELKLHEPSFRTYRVILGVRINIPSEIFNTVDGYTARVECQQYIDGKKSAKIVLRDGKEEIYFDQVDVYKSHAFQICCKGMWEKDLTSEASACQSSVVEKLC